jgi:hypothetical protein
MLKETPDHVVFYHAPINDRLYKLDHILSKLRKFPEYIKQQPKKPNAPLKSHDNALFTKKRLRKRISIENQRAIG